MKIILLEKLKELKITENNNNKKNNNENEENNNELMNTKSFNLNINKITKLYCVENSIEYLWKKIPFIYEVEPIYNNINLNLDMPE